MKLFYNASAPFNWLVVNKGKIFQLGIGKPDPSLSIKQKIDLGGRTIFPGWIESHCHLFLLGKTKMDIDVSECESFGEIRSRIRPFLQHRTWIEAFGCDPMGWSPSRENLDQISREIPIVIRRKDEHAMWVNSAVLTLIGREPEGSGELIDHACERVYQVRPKLSDQDREVCFLKAQEELLKVGITSVHYLSMTLF